MFFVFIFLCMVTISTAHLEAMGGVMQSMIDRQKEEERNRMWRLQCSHSHKALFDFCITKAQNDCTWLALDKGFQLAESYPLDVDEDFAWETSDTIYCSEHGVKRAPLEDFFKNNNQTIKNDGGSVCTGCKNGIEELRCKLICTLLDKSYYPARDYAQSLLAQKKRRWFSSALDKLIVLQLKRALERYHGEGNDVGMSELRSSPGSHPDYLGMLPTRALYEIFRFLKEKERRKLEETSKYIYDRMASFYSVPQRKVIRVVVNGLRQNINDILKHIFSFDVQRVHVVTLLTLAQSDIEKLKKLFHQKFKNIVELDVSQTHLIPVFTDLINLQILNLGSTYAWVTSQHWVPALTNLTNLRILNLSYNYLRFVNGGIRSLASALAKLIKLQVLDLSKNHFGGDAVGLALAFEQLTNLQRLDLRDNDLDDEQKNAIRRIFAKIALGKGESSQGKRPSGGGRILLLV